ncbi:MAG: DUF4440 domain-containing protein [Actinomycetales bacterium]|nr:DUF4440 domain-containing protein [Actinomycetales bacterium]
MPDTDGRLDEDSVLAELTSLEPLFHAPGGMTRAEYEALTAPDFAEVGASGRRYDREVIWAVLAERFASGEPEPAFELTQAAVRRLAPRVWVLTYDLLFGGRRSRRVSIWERVGARWRVVYHQGTPV